MRFVKPLAAKDPRTAGPYRLLGRLGEGGMGCVYLGRSVGGRTVAVKVVRAELAADPDFRARFRREVAAARRVGEVGTTPVLDADTEAEQPWVASGYVVGPSLAQAVDDFGPLAEDGVRALVAGLAEALAHVHGLGLIHRDVKPSNVMLSPDGPVLIDFGIARAMDASATGALTRSSVVVGSPGYLSPEQLLGQPLGPACDVFQLGTVLVFAATGEGPFPAANPAALLYKVAHEEPELGSLQGRLSDVARACLAKDPARRPQPGEIARLLTPGGAGAAFAAGWLPGPVMTQISRRAVELLNLDAAPEAPRPTSEQLPDPAAVPEAAAPSVVAPPVTTASATRPLRVGWSAPDQPASDQPAPDQSASDRSASDRSAPDPSGPSEGGGSSGRSGRGGPNGRAGRGEPGGRTNRRMAAVVGGAIALAAVATTAVVLALPSSADNSGHRSGAGSTASGAASGSASGSASADPASRVGPYKPVADLCGKIDASRLAQVFGPLARAPQPTKPLQGGNGVERDCALVFLSGKVVTRVDVTASFTQDPDFAKSWFAGLKAAPADTSPPVPIGDDAFQKVERSVLNPLTFITYELEVRQANLVTWMLVQTQEPPYSDSATVTLTDVMKDMVAGLN